MPLGAAPRRHTGSVKDFRNRLEGFAFSAQPLNPLQRFSLTGQGPRKASPLRIARPSHACAGGALKLEYHHALVVFGDSEGELYHKLAPLLVADSP